MGIDVGLEKPQLISQVNLFFFFFYSKPKRQVKLELFKRFCFLGVTVACYHNIPAVYQIKQWYCQESRAALDMDILFNCKFTYI